MLFFRIFQHVLPNARAWRLTAEKTLRGFFEGLTGQGEDVKEYYDLIFNDLDPTLTRDLPSWEEQFALTDVGLSVAERRIRLSAAWAARGGQSPRYIQDTLQAAGFDVYVHEWWVPSVEHPTGGSVDGDVTPTARNPFNYLDDGSSGIPYTMFDGGSDSQDGDALSQDGGTLVPVGYPLVNKIIIGTLSAISDGTFQMQDGSTEAQDGKQFATYQNKQYVIPADPTKYPFFLYIGAEVFPDQAMLTQSRRDEFEDLCLKICPTEQWLGILVTYS